MATELTIEFAKDLLKDNLDEDRARRILAAVGAMISSKTAQISEILALGVSGTREFNPPVTADYDVLFLFTTEACTVQLASGGTSIDVAADGVLVLQSSARTYFKITMGATAGTVAVLLAT